MRARRREDFQNSRKMAKRGRERRRRGEEGGTIYPWRKNVSLFTSRRTNSIAECFKKACENITVVVGAGVLGPRGCREEKVRNRQSCQYACGYVKIKAH